jgi:hypothetical protein
MDTEFREDREKPSNSGENSESFFFQLEHDLDRSPQSKQFLWHLAHHSASPIAGIFLGEALRLILYAPCAPDLMKTVAISFSSASLRVHYGRI